MGEREALLTRLYEAFNRRDIEAVLSALHPLVDWPDQLEGGRRHGRDDLRGYWLAQFELIRSDVSPLQFEALADGRLAVTVMQNVYGKDGRLWSQGKVRHLYRFDDDLIARMDVEEL